MLLLSLIFFQLKPPSSDLYNAFFFDSTKAYMMFVLLGAIAKPILPKSPLGKPSASVFFDQVLPPS